MKTKSFFAALMLLFCATSLWASDTSVDGIWYDFDYSTMTATVTYRGSSFDAYSHEYSGNVSIPASVTYSGKTYSVTSIGDQAFYNCINLNSIEIPNSVTSIGNSAFPYCSSLTSVTIGNSVTSIGTGAFSYCSSLTSVTIPNSVTSIGDYTFYECSSLTSVTIGNNVTSIGNYAFYECSSLTSVTIPNSVTSIGYQAFWYCRSLTSVTIPNSVTSIGEGAFYGCSGLTSVTIGNSVTSIGDYVFTGCSSLTAIYVPCGEMGQFKQMLQEYSNKVKYEPLPYSITINAEHGKVTSPLTICDDMQLEVIPHYGYHFSRWSDGNTDNPRTIELMQDTTFTAEFAIDRNGTCGDNNALTWMYDPAVKALTITGEGTLNSNYTYGVEAPDHLTKLVVSEGVTTIGAYAFANQANLQEVSLPTTLMTVGEQAFLNCIGLTDMYNYRERPCIAYDNSFEGTNKFDCTLHVLSASVDMYKIATGWRDFYYIQTIDATSTIVSNDKVNVEPTTTTADIVWPIVEGAATYELVIKDKNGNVVCTLIFNANGQLTQIAFFSAPARDNATQAAGFSFTVTGLEEGTSYDLTITAKDSNGTTLDEKTIAFTTAGSTDADALQVDKRHSSKVIRNGQLFIQKAGKTYTIQGIEVK